MNKPKRKTGWSHLLSLIFAAALIVGSFIFFEFWTSAQESEISASRVILDPAPMPTQIDQNFFDQVRICFIPTAKVYGYSLEIMSGFRSMSEQDQLFDIGRKTEGEVVTKARGGKSLHNFGFAVDIVDRRRGYDLDWEKLNRIAEFCGLEAGGETDPPHFDHRDGLEISDFILGRRPAPLALPCPVMAQRWQENEYLTSRDLKNCGVGDF